MKSELCFRRLKVGPYASPGRVDSVVGLLRGKVDRSQSSNFGSERIYARWIGNGRRVRLIGIRVAIIARPSIAGAGTGTGIARTGIIAAGVLGMKASRA